MQASTQNVTQKGIFKGALQNFLYWTNIEHVCLASRDTAYKEGSFKTQGCEVSRDFNTYTPVLTTHMAGLWICDTVGFVSVWRFHQDES